jgi:hypothetical protein
MKFNQVTPKSIHLQNILNNSRKIIIIYPHEKKYARIARYVLQRLFNNLGNYEVLIVLPDLFLDYKDVHPVPYITIPAHTTNSFYNSLLKILGDFNADILIQLDPNPPKGFLKTIHLLLIDLKIGLGADQSVYNVTHTWNGKGFYENYIISVLRMLNIKIN